MLSFRVSLLLLMVTLAMVIKTANSKPMPMKLEVSIKKSHPSGGNTKHQDTVRLTRSRTGGRSQTAVVSRKTDPACVGLAMLSPLATIIYAAVKGCTYD